MTDRTILVVEDEQSIREMIAFNLKRSGFEVITAEDCAAARVRIAEQLPDLILLDWMLPDMSGLEFSRHLRKEELTREVPIILLTARAEEDDKVRGLESGADDYVTKPFSNRELLARINAVLRRVSSEDEEARITINDLSLDLAGHRVSANTKPVQLGPTEFRLLSFFMSHPERVYSRSQLLDRVWGSNVYVEERTVDVHIRRLRKALEPHDCDGMIQTVRGAGYRFSSQEA